MKNLYMLGVMVLLCLKMSGQCSVVVTQSTNASCFGNCDGSVSLVTVGTSPFVYSWMPGGQTVQNPSDLCAGTHTVTMTDANSCQATATVTITQPQDIAINMTTSNVRCNGNCDGSAQAAVTGGTFPYSYSWTDPQMSTTDTANSLCPGSYTCTVTDFNGCAKFAVASIMEPAVLSAVISSQNASCNGSCDGIVSANASGGTAPYHYAWNSGCATASCSQVCAGGYMVTVTDTNQCMLSDSAFVNEPSAIIVNASETDASCLTCNDGTATCAPTGGSGNFTYMWSPGGQTTQSISGLAPGNYTVCVTDMNGCSQCSSVTVAAMSGIVEGDLSDLFSIYPNPANTILTIYSEITVVIHYRVLDITGKTVMAGEYESYPGMAREIDIHGIAGGAYFLEIKTGENKMVKKVLKE